MKQSLALILLILFLSSGNTLAKGFDVITMNNGDVHNGIIDNNNFIFKTSFGEIIIPYINMAELQLTHIPHQDRLLTHSGDLFVGDLKEEDVIILRTLDPALPAPVNSIAQIHFSKKNSYQYNKNMSDIVSSHFGDFFSADFLPESIKIISENKTLTVLKDNIHTIDIDRIIDDDKTTTQIRTKNGRIYHGELDIQNISFNTIYNLKLNIKLQELHSITLNTNNEHLHKQVSDKLNWKKSYYIRDKFNDRTLGPEMVKLDSSIYFRGDNKGDDDEKPVMPVNIKAFLIGSHEVTFEQYDAFCDDSKLTRPDDQEWGRGSRPVVNVSWENAVAYTQWLSKKTGKIYRLPTDAEWEYAARAGSVTSFWWGNNVSIAMANCEGCNSIWSGEKTAPVGRFPANSFGLYDTAGNVFEWVADCYHNTFEHAPKDGSAIDKPGCGKRVIRGGAWSFPAKESRSANRWRDFPTRSSDDTGFRVARELDF